MITEQTISEILKLAAHAPSGDNSQPWRFEVSGSVIRTFNLPERDIPFYNYEQKGSYLAHGALIENIMIAASMHGLSAEVKLLPNDRNPDLTAEITLIESNTPQDPLASYIAKRQTNRRHYLAEKLQDAAKHRILACGSRGGDSLCKITICEDKEQLKRLGKALSANERTVLETPTLRQIFFHHVVWTQQQERQVRTGLYVTTLEMNAIARFIFKQYSVSARAEFLNRLGFSRIIANENAKLYAASGALVAVSVPNNKSDAAGFLEAGRVTQRIWLEATALGLSAHPVTGVLFLMHRINANQTGSLHPSHIALVKESYREIEEILSTQGQTLAMILRIGQAQPATDYSSKLPIQVEYKNTP